MNTHRNQCRQHVLKEISDLILKDQKLSNQIETDNISQKILNALPSILRKEKQLHPFLKDAHFHQEIIDYALKLGPLEPLIRNPKISEIMVNGSENVFVEMDGKVQTAPISFNSDSELMTFIARIVSPLGRRLDESSPMVDARLKDGSRVNAIIPPLSIDGPTLTIRKFPQKRLQILDLIKMNALSPQAARFLQFCVQNKFNMVVAGGTGSGKTSLLNILSSFIPPHERLITIEDAAELKLGQKHVVRLETRNNNVEGSGEVTVRELLKNALRMRPDRIIVGECRGDEVFDMLQAMNTGHEGSLTTLHANSPRDTLYRIENMILSSGKQIPLNALRDQIASAIDIIVFIKRGADGKRYIEYVSEICGVDSGRIILQDIFFRKENALNAIDRIPQTMRNMGSEQLKLASHIFLKKGSI